jgi:hypothetical protein
MQITINLPPALQNVFEMFSFLDSPGTYIMLMVIGLVIIPFYVKGVYSHIKNPQDYHMTSFEEKFWLGLFIIAALILFGYLNFTRFLT